MKKINKIIFLLLIMFIYINNVDASFKCNSYRETLSEKSEASSAGFKANMPGCYHWEFTGNYESMGPYDDFKNAAAVADEFKKAYYSIDGKSLHSTYVPMCTGEKEKAHVTATVKCTYLAHSLSTRHTEKFKRYTKDAEYDINNSYRDYEDKGRSEVGSVRTCSDLGESACKSKSGCVWSDGGGGTTATLKSHKQIGVFVSPSIGCSGSTTWCNSGTKDGDKCYSCSSGTYSTTDHTCLRAYCTNNAYHIVSGSCRTKIKMCPDGYEHDPDDFDNCLGAKYCPSASKGYKLTSDEKECEMYDCPIPSYTLSADNSECSLLITQRDDTEKRDVGYIDLQVTNINKRCNIAASKYEGNHVDKGVVVDDCECDISYNYECPMYKCPTEVQTIDTCTPKFQDSDENTVYCLNPSKPFTSTFTSTAEYQIDDSFNARKCTSSHGTIECGYANILIEAKYINEYNKKNHITGKNVSDNAIELALRLWAVHTDRKGFNSYGLSNKRGTSCNTSMWYKTWNDKVTNVYKYTHDEMMKRFFEGMDSVIRGMDNVNVSSSTTLNALKIVCVPSGKQPSDMVAVACGDEIVYRQAYALFFNTLVGNKDMQSHLSYLYNGELALPPEGAYYRTDEYGSYVEVTYNEEEFKKAFRLYEGTDVEIDCKRLDTRNPHYDDIKPYCFTKVDMLNNKDEVINESTDSGTMDVCYLKDSSCRRRVSLVALCDITLDKLRVTKIQVTTERKASSYSIKQYVSCENPDVNQSMVAYGEPGKAISVSPKPTIDIFYVPAISCKGVCTDYSVRDSVNKECVKTGTVYGRVFSSSIKDPSLNCIVNMRTGYGKDMYDYTDYYKVNKSLCSIYCSDEVEYYIADKETGVSGRTFKYDIEPRVNGTRLVSYPLTSMIKERRTCVSEIYYENQIPDTTNLKKDYGLTQEEANKIKNFKDLYAFLKAKSDKEGSRVENINQIIYDLYNCNLYSQSVFTANGIQKPRGSLTGNLRESIKNQYSKSNNYGLVASNSDCEIDVEAGINTCIKEKDIQYNWGSSPDGTTVKVSSVQTISSIFSKLTYCTGSECFVYDKDNDANSYVYPKPTDADKTNRLIGDNKAAQAGKPREGQGTLSLTGNLKKWFGKTSIKIPVNDYVLFDITVDVDFYNSSKYQSLPDTGEVINKGSRSGNFLTLDDYLFTISKNAYNMCDRINDTISRCKIEQEFETVATFFRKTRTDEFVSKVNSCNKFTCYVDVKTPCPILDEDISACTRYRNVDTANLFPRYESIPSNWTTTEGAAAKTQIENTSELLKAKDLLEYRITLTPTQIKNIKDYNKNHSAYKLEPVIESTCTNVSNEYYINCKTEFMNLLRDDTTHKYGELDPDYRDGVSLYNKTLHP